jgi:hypothetical protein
VRSVSAVIDLQLFRGDLDDGGLHALPELRLAGEHGDLALGVDPDPGVEEGLAREASGELGLGRRRRSRALHLALLA